MYRLAFALLLLATPAQAQSARALTHDEVVLVFQGQQACYVPNEEGACTSVQIVLESDADTLRTRTFGLTNLVGFGEEPLSELVRGLAIYQPYADLFVALEAQRAAHGALYLKQVETSVGRWDTQARAYCRQTDFLTSSRDLELYFSSNTTASVEADYRLSDTDAQRLREFFAALLADAEFRDAVGGDPEFRLMLDVISGARPVCMTYAGGELNDELLLVGIVAFSNNEQINGLTEAIAMRPASDALPLIPE